MNDIKMNLNEMKIMLSNDDGIEAHGIKILESIVRKFCNNIIVIAPDSNRSGASHSLTLANPFRAQKIDDNHYAVGGSPVDSVTFGLRNIFTSDDYPDLIISGINSDANLSDDTLYSGTIGAAREGCLFGIPSIALSQQMYEDRTINWEVSEHYTEIVLKNILENYSFCNRVFLSVNFPAVKINEVKGIRITFQGHRQITDRLVKYVDPRNVTHYMVGLGEYINSEDINTLDSDIGAIKKGYITITPLTTDATSYEQVNVMKNIFNTNF